MEKPDVVNEGWEPRIVAFFMQLVQLCGRRPGGYGETSVSVQYPDHTASLLGEDRPAVILLRPAEGADGVMVSGCHPGDCHYLTGNM